MPWCIPTSAELACGAAAGKVALSHEEPEPVNHNQVLMTGVWWWVSSAGRGLDPQFEGHRVTGWLPSGIGRTISFTRVHFLCWLFSFVYSTSMFPQWHITAKSASGRLHLKTHTPSTYCNQRGLTVLSRHSLETCQWNKLTCNSLGNARHQLFQLSEPLWTDPGLKSGFDAPADLYETKGKKEEKKASAGNNLSNHPQ